MSTYSRRLFRLLTQDGETGPERRPSVNVSLHGAAAKCCSWVHLGCLSRLGLPLACGELWCKGILQLTSRVRVRFARQADHCRAWMACFSCCPRAGPGPGARPRPAHRAWCRRRWAYWPGVCDRARPPAGDRGPGPRREREPTHGSCLVLAAAAAAGPLS